MDDDFNTPLAMAVLFDLANELNKTKSPALARQFKALADVIGLLGRTPQQFLQGGVGGATSGDAAAIEARRSQRAAKPRRRATSPNRTRSAPTCWRPASSSKTSRTA
jgi:cysteinyl-tRNA synthetase